MPAACISVLNWYGADHTIACIESLRRMAYQDYQLIVVDNASGDDSAARIQQAFPDVHLIQTASNLGFADGHRVALQEALKMPDVRLFWLLNNDAVVKVDTLSKLVAAYETYGTGVYGGVAMQDDLLIGLMGEELDADGKKLRDLSAYSSKPYTAVFPETQPRPVTLIHGSSFMIPMEVIHKHGFMDDAFFLYGEEVDYCHRLRAQGILLMLVPESVILHDAHAATSGSGLYALRHYYMTRNVLFLNKRYEGLGRMLNRIRTQHLRLAFRGLWQSLIIRFGKLIRAKRVTVHDLPVEYYRYLGVRDVLLNRMGKRLAPEDFRE